MDGKSASYVVKYDQLTRESSAFFTRRDLALELAGPTPGRVLEPGCGPGVVSPILARRSIETHGVDVSAGQLRTAAARDPLSLYVQGDLRALPYRDSAFTTVMLLGVLEYIENPERVLRELGRVMAEKGRLIVSVPNATGLPRRWTHHAYLPLTRLAKRALGRPVPAYYRCLYTAASLTILLEATGFRVDQARFFDVMLAAPPLDRLFGNDPPKLAGYLEKRLHGPLRTVLSTQLMVGAIKEPE
jgi:ubiquinone/menaquinone biosynthesis C-methylase UbiE